MSSKDYYMRLKEMQSRLEKARNDIHLNVSNSRSRSASHSETRLSQQMNYPTNVTRQTITSQGVRPNQTPSQTAQRGPVQKMIALSDLGKNVQDQS